jgi:hypothetical protein
MQNSMKLQCLNTHEKSHDYAVYGLIESDVEAECQRIREQQEHNIIKIMRQVCDFPVVCHFLGMIGSPKTHGYYGMLGAISSLLSIYRHWPVVYVDEKQKND